jgi:hypothetical protein
MTEMVEKRQENSQLLRLNRVAAIAPAGLPVSATDETT